jgi:hypothetical protein
MGNKWPFDNSSLWYTAIMKTMIRNGLKSTVNYKTFIFSESENGIDSAICSVIDIKT